MNYDKVLVLGGTGFLGKNLQEIRPDWIYLGRKAFIENGVECDYQQYSGPVDYTEMACIYGVLSLFKPDAVINLVADVGGIAYNKENQLSIYENNILMNTNILKACREKHIGRVLSSLSTCAWPDMDSSMYPTDEGTLFGASIELPYAARLPAISHPFEGHMGYGWSKRMMQVHTELIRKEGLNYSTFAPTNLYGPHDHMGEDNGSHFVAALVHKISELSHNQSLKLMGDGQARRQFMYAPDLAGIIPQLLEHHNGGEPVVVAGIENLSINEMAEKSLKVLDKKNGIEYSGEHTGQHRKDCQSPLLEKIIGEQSFTSFEEGFKKTYRWYKHNV
jgi:GDP-L-fucose synthase